MLSTQEEIPLAPSHQKLRVNWRKCDLQEYCTTVEDGFQKVPTGVPDTRLEADILLREVTNVLYNSSCAVTKQHSKRRKSKSGLPIWTPEIKEAVQKSKLAHAEWKSAGRPSDKENCATVRRKNARRTLRRCIRLEVSARREVYLTSIMDAHETDSRAFFRMIKRQRSSKSTNTQLLEYQDRTLTGPEEVANGFASHFEALATPADDPQFDASYHSQVTLDKLLIEDICTNQESVYQPTTPLEIEKIVQTFKNNKAQDLQGLSAEHLKFAPDVTYVHLSNLMNFIMQTGYIPNEMKIGVITPVLKKDKDARLPTNYRGITVLSIIGKVLEKVLLKRTETTLCREQSRFQRGFTRNSSSTNAALIVTEVQNEAKLNKQNLHLVTLDACKAFDVVWQDSLLRKVYLAGVDGSMWLTLSSLYNGASSSVKWSGHVSQPFTVRQGVRQGGILSTLHYKLFNNGLLHMLESLHLGAFIGHINCCAPTCADDVALLGTCKRHLRELLHTVWFYKGRERYLINAQKSVEILLSIIKMLLEMEQLTLDNIPIPQEAETVHLGVDRNLKADGNVEKKAQLGRRTMYSMMGAGAYGNSGLNPSISCKMWKTFALPRMLYGLEVCSLRRADITALETVQKGILRRIQCLPDRTANVAVYGLLGVRPVEQELDARKLSLMASVLFDEESLEHEIALRQLAVKDTQDDSWFMQCNTLLHKYGLPNIFCIRDAFISKGTLKEAIKKGVDQYTKSQWQSEANEKSSLKYLNFAACGVGQVHNSWASTSNSVRDVRRAQIKVRMLTGSYVLQSNRAKFNKAEVSPACPLCKRAPEDMCHFLLECPSLQSVR
ncbi:MAG: reverse transcriptase domain-containing protein, partial [Candidatus Thiodiazotropha endolucinida]|nr:reverse transcriptase domain-containing protein [Candidatus Thiodiazotropha endolucinida]